MDFSKLSYEQQLFCSTALARENIRVEACIGSGKTTAIQALCDLFPKNKYILYLTYNKLLKVDAKNKIKNENVVVTNYHGFVYPYLMRNGIKCGISESIRTFTANKLSIPRFDILIIDEYQDIELDFAEMLEYVKSTNPRMQIIMVGDMSQKIYDKTTLDVAKWSQSFLGNHVELEFTQCFRLQPELAAKLGRIWGKTIVGVNNDCCVEYMNKSDIIKYLAQQKPGDILCLGSKTGPMTDVLNELEFNFPDKFNKQTVYATIKDSAANIEPNAATAVFTTFDSSKGMEKPICVVFDWDEAYWSVRSKKPDTNSDILRNIFCVAASRGKHHIIFAKCRKSGKISPLLSEETLMTPIEIKPLTKAYVIDMFSFKFVEEIAKAYEMLDITCVNDKTSEIDILDHDGLIDISPCIAEYQKMIFFLNYNIDTYLKEAAEINETPIKMDIVKQLAPEQKLLYLISLLTKQNRYRNQVHMPFVNIEQHNMLMDRLSEHLSRDDMLVPVKTYNLNGITIYSQGEIFHDNRLWQIEFKQSLCPEDYLRLAMELIIYNKQNGMLWNTRTNELYKINIDESKRKAFVNQVHRVITKQKYANTASPDISKFKELSDKNYLEKEINFCQKAKSNPATTSFAVNDTIIHKIYGRGVVEKVTSRKKYQILEITFENNITRSIMSNHVTLSAKQDNY